MSQPRPYLLLRCTPVLAMAYAVRAQKPHFLERASVVMVDHFWVIPSNRPERHQELVSCGSGHDRCCACAEAALPGARVRRDGGPRVRPHARAHRQLGAPLPGVQGHARHQDGRLQEVSAPAARALRLPRAQPSGLCSVRRASGGRLVPCSGGARAGLRKTADPPGRPHGPVLSTERNWG